MNEELKLKRQKWYNNKTVQFELLSLMKNKEVCFMDRKNPINVIRALRITSLKYLNDTFKNFSFFERDYNIYISVATYSEIPNFTLNLKKRSVETSEWFKENAVKKIVAYDFLHDFDCKDVKNFSAMKKEVETLLFTYERELIKYSIYPSGNNFQVIIPSNISDKNTFSKTRENEDTLNGYTYKYIKAIKERFNFKYLDLKGIGSFNKVRKLPFSLVGERVCLPLAYWWFKNQFVYEDMHSNNVLKEFKIAYMGHKFLNDMGEEYNKRHFKEFTRRYFLD